ncbi:MAG: RNA-dependent RNA polymerase [Sanya totivirus 9]|nr:MAG: RNA-dependent RNA polymerase [Sanya totivirus 9]
MSSASGSTVVSPLVSFLTGFSSRWKCVADIGTLDYSDQISLVYRPSWGGVNPPRLARAAVSFLKCTVPVQVPLESSDFQLLLCSLTRSSLLPPFDSLPKWLEEGHSTMVKRFPFKKGPAMDKANIRVDEVWDAVKSRHPASALYAAPYLVALADLGYTNDVAASFLLYGTLLQVHTQLGYAWGFLCVTDPKLAKEVSVFLKAVGANSCAYGALLVECDTLQGRDPGAADLTADAFRRCDLAKASAEVLAKVDLDVLRSAVRKILRSEIRTVGGSYHIDFPSMEEHWESRWLWAANGAHSALVKGDLPVPQEIRQRVNRLHRRAWLETQKDDPRENWDGVVYVSCAPKFEAGKTRAIYACDTVSYLAFEHLLGPVEKRWQGRKVVLNPGKGGHLGMIDRVRFNRNRSGVSVMLDYDDFNSQHTNQAMKVVFEELCGLVGYAPELSRRLIDSFDKQVIHLNGKRIGTSVGTLMSGHRATTFLNSVLNKAYLDVVLGLDWLDERQSIHVGDDVYIGARSYADVGFLVGRVNSSPLRLNRAKQSVGHVSTEFLRIATNESDSFGYLSRAVAGLVAGNWTTDKVLGPREALRTIIQGARTLINRSRVDEAALLVEPSVRRVLAGSCDDDAVIPDLLLGNIALDDGPQYHSSGTIRQVLSILSEDEPDECGYRDLPKFSTTSFLSTHASPLELDVLTSEGLDPSSTMIKSSWSKSLSFREVRRPTLKFSHVLTRKAVGSSNVSTLLKLSPPRGVLNRYPLLVLVKDRISLSTLRRAVAACGGNPNSSDLKLEAWGEYSNPVIVNSVMSYSDACMFARRTDASVITANHRCFV